MNLPTAYMLTCPARAAMAAATEQRWAGLGGGGAGGFGCGGGGGRTGVGGDGAVGAGGGGDGMMRRALEESVP